MSTRNLVFGDDGSPSADRAWLWVSSHRWPGWQCEILRAHLPDLGPPPAEDDLHVHPWDPPTPRKRFDTAEFDDVVDLFAEHDPRLVMCREADLLVVGPTGGGFWKKLHLGSVTEWLLHHPPHPMVIARTGHATQKVLVCSDGSSHSHAAVEAFVSLPWAGDVEARVIEAEGPTHDIEMGGDEVVAKFAAIGVDCRIIRDDREATAAILAEIESFSPDLVVMGTKGHTGWSRIQLGSTAAAVARKAACSVLLACSD
jgi:nucleotide-binding universal stress UspA family protein